LADVKIKICPTEDEGFIGPINSKPQLEKGKSRRTGCKGMAKRHYLPVKF
jgi:hypothetical protein